MTSNLPMESNCFTNSQELRFFTEALIKSMNEGHIKVTCDSGYPFEPVRLLHLSDRIGHRETEHKREIDDLLAKLKIAEDALKKIASNSCICESGYMAKKALAMIRGT